MPSVLADADFGQPDQSPTAGPAVHDAIGKDPVGIGGMHR